MCLPTKTSDQSDAPVSGARSMLGMGALMLVTCLAGPAIAGAVGSLGLGGLVGAGAVIFAIGVCAAVPAGALGRRRRLQRRAPRVALSQSRRGA